ncbi:unnamed protein product [Phaedon cochleariae]|uniref:RdRp catalytic domain-containing protein n=1 Tax=Phaedon cochleariae TaxID=80249 RepID=A0A9P0GPH2_PHACE|nr:unnamed protein product [Phaedon cochleariae]
MEKNTEVERALLAYLLMPHFDATFTKYLANYQNDEVWEISILDYLVIKSTSKELEEKPEGRIFGASPLEERNRRVVQEENVMKLMGNHVPDQLMAPNGLEMIKKLYSFRYLKTVYLNHTVQRISLDFNKWNNSMRHQSMSMPAGAVLDKWFGTNWYGMIMKSFQESLVYYKDHHVERHWLVQEGGIEEMARATWSYFFIAGVEQA